MASKWLQRFQASHLYHIPSKRREHAFLSHEPTEHISSHIALN